MKKILPAILLAGIFLMTACKSTQVRKSHSGEQIENLKSGVLLVRLASGTQKVKQLKASGQTQRAEETQRAIILENERIVFFAWLENKRDAAGKIAGFCQVLRGTKKHGCVAIMPAGVHFAFMGRGVFKPCGFRDRQSVHVRAQTN